MKTNSLADVFRAHLSERGLGLASPSGSPLDPISEQFALRDLAEVAADVFATAPGGAGSRDNEITREIPRYVLEDLNATARVA